MNPVCFFIAHFIHQLYVLCCYWDHVQHYFFFILMGLPVVATSLNCRQQQSKPIGSPKALLYHMTNGAHNRLSNLVFASTQSFLIPEPPALVWHGWKYSVWYCSYHKWNSQNYQIFKDHGGSWKGGCYKEFLFRDSKLMQKSTVVKMWSAWPRSLTLCLLLCFVGYGVTATVGGKIFTILQISCLTRGFM